MPPVLRPASALSIGALTALFNESYADYVVAMHPQDEGAIRWMVESFDIDLDASRVVLVDGTPVGFANLGLRGREAWIGGIGVVPAARRHGHGELLMRAVQDEAEARRASKVWLEVIEQNEPAYRLYEKLGYDVVRELEVWSLAGEVAAGSAREVPAARAHERIRELRTGREPWQRADATLAHHADAQGLETAAGAAVFRVAGSVQLVQIAGADTAELLRTMRSRGPVVALNVPAADPAAEALRVLGGTTTVRQREMVLDLTRG